jgi:hypothetical protein
MMCALGKTRPPVTWFNVRAMEENDLRSQFRYIKSLGESGERIGRSRAHPYYLLRPTPPKG